MNESIYGRWLSLVARTSQNRRTMLRLETLEARNVLSASPLPLPVEPSDTELIQFLPEETPPGEDFVLDDVVYDESWMENLDEQMFWCGAGVETSEDGSEVMLTAEMGEFDPTLAYCYFLPPEGVDAFPSEGEGVSKEEFPEEFVDPNLYMYTGVVDGVLLDSESGEEVGTTVGEEVYDNEEGIVTFGEEQSGEEVVATVDEEVSVKEEGIVTFGELQGDDLLIRYFGMNFRGEAEESESGEGALDPVPPASEQEPTDESIFYMLPLSQGAPEESETSEVPVAEVVEDGEIVPFTTSGIELAFQSSVVDDNSSVNPDLTSQVSVQRATTPAPATLPTEEEAADVELTIGLEATGGVRDRRGLLGEGW